ncbi:hypothetical protein BOTBODRAFT_325747 [Botryobasidium botryosum FD-172 SS1]|uniref:Uncharacterized protein n=1 Tax=Botryobasidium botryosum (strain FD-172 SS1) TaxID=930990 RepID=A0A067NB57_BOTB1|nr:hypothetical protein BOTBODRAFT_325747 [Botryobasidium botryosum FD-172 SS1]
MDIDTSWCPVCDRYIPPARYTVPVEPAPESKPKARKPQPKRALSADDDATPTARTRTIISRDPTPLYCSEQCRLADASSFAVGTPRKQAAPPSPLFVSGSESDLDSANGDYFEYIRRTAPGSSSSDSLNSMWDQGHIMTARRHKASMEASADARKGKQRIPSAIQVNTARYSPAPHTSALPTAPIQFSRRRPSAGASAAARGSSVPTTAAELYTSAYPLAFHRSHSSSGVTRPLHQVSKAGDRPSRKAQGLLLSPEPAQASLPGSSNKSPLSFDASPRDHLLRLPIPLVSPPTTLSATTSEHSEPHIVQASASRRLPDALPPRMPSELLLDSLIRSSNGSTDTRGGSPKSVSRDFVPMYPCPLLPVKPGEKRKRYVYSISHSLDPHTHSFAFSPDYFTLAAQSKLLLLYFTLLSVTRIISLFSYNAHYYNIRPLGFSRSSPPRHPHISLPSLLQVICNPASLSHLSHVPKGPERA